MNKSEKAIFILVGSILILCAVLAQAKAQCYEGTNTHSTSLSDSLDNKAKVKSLILEEGYLVPIGDCHYGGTKALPYKFDNGNKDEFYIWHDGEWRKANPVDWDLLN